MIITKSFSLATPSLTDADFTGLALLTSGRKRAEVLRCFLYSFFNYQITSWDVGSSVEGVMPVLCWSKHALCWALNSKSPERSPRDLEPKEDMLQQREDASSKSREQWQSLGRKRVFGGWDIWGAWPGQRGSPAMPWCGEPMVTSWSMGGSGQSCASPLSRSPPWL